MTVPPYPSPQMPYPSGPAPTQGPVDLAYPQRGATFAQAVSRFFRKYAVFSGRASRSEYAWVLLFQAIAALVLVMLVFVGGRPMLAVLLVWVLGTFVPTIALHARRLHDTGKSGWWQLIGLATQFGSIFLLVLLLTEPKPAGEKYGPGLIAYPWYEMLGRNFIG
jgi:uncharacterized membrane protein YhaH (DUF805 family)